MHRYSEQLGNIAGRQRAERALEAARVSAEQAAASATEAMKAARASDQAKSAFLANMSHELRTPLNAIIGFSQVLAAQSLGPIGVSQYVEYTHDILASAQHLLAIINDILDLARIEAGKGELREELVDAMEMTAACVRIVRQRAEVAGLKIETKAPDAQILLWADERKLRQILINLLSNAIKFSSSGGAITIAWRLRVEGGCQFIVSDTGIGIAEADLGRVLEPFAQADGAFNRRYEGTGLGLPLTRRMTEMHGGSLTLESELGRGTTVTVTLPRERVQCNRTGPSKMAFVESLMAENDND
jgi:signal transduction histidine kinase